MGLKKELAQIEAMRRYALNCLTLIYDRRTANEKFSAEASKASEGLIRPRTSLLLLAEGFHPAARYLFAASQHASGLRGAPCRANHALAGDSAGG